MQYKSLSINYLTFKQGYTLLLLLFIATWLQASPLQINSSIYIDAIKGHGMDLSGVTITFDAKLNGATSYNIHINSALFSEHDAHIKDIVLACLDGQFSGKEISCTEGEISFESSVISANSAPISFDKKKNGELLLQVSEIQLAEGQASIVVEIKEEGWVASVSSVHVSLSKLKTLFPNLYDLSLIGNMKSDFTLTGNQSTIRTIQGDAVIADLAFSNQESSLVGENVSAKLTFNSQRKDRVWESEFSSTFFDGELYLDPVFIDVNAGAKDAYGIITWEVGTKRIELKPLHFEDQHAMHLAIDTKINFEEKRLLAPIQIGVDYAVFPTAYEVYIQPFLLDSNLADLSTSGSLAGAMVVNNAVISELDLKLDNFSIEDKRKRFALTKLDGEIGWGSRYSDTEYSLGFDSADLYKIRLGQTKFSFFNQGDALVLDQVVSVPILDGGLTIESFLVSQPGKRNQSISLDLSLTPISMRNISSVFGWPEMNGNLAGYAPNVVYRQGNVDVQGALLVRAFEGTTTIHNLKARDLFSITPKLFADIQITNLDLSALTETFSFGEITGKLSGYITDLQFVSWQPTQFDAWLGTPVDDKSKHKISQTAVDNLTQVGNGASNIFSKSFLRFLDNFSYDRLGLGCRLKNATCKMRGVTAADKGFYIVKGSGVPRIDIVGFNDEVSWPVLIARLKRVVSTQELIVQ